MMGTLRFSTLMTLGVFLALATANQAFAGDGLLYAVDSACDCLYSVRADGTKTVIGPLAQDPGESFLVPTKMAMDLDGTTYVQDGIAMQLLTVNLLTGDATAVGQIPIVEALAINRMAVPRSGGQTWPAGTLFAVAGVPPFGQARLVVLDKTSGAVLNTIGTIPSIGGSTPRIGSLSFRSDGVLFGAELGGPGRLFRVSTVDATLAAVGSIGPDFGVLGAIAFDPSDGFWVSDIGNAKLFAVDEGSATIRCAIPLAQPSPGNEAFVPPGYGVCTGHGRIPFGLRHR